MGQNHLIKRNQIYYYRIKIPADLTHLVPSREIKQSLKTNDSSSARVLAANLNSKIHNVFALLRSECLTAEQILELVASVLPSRKQLNMQLIFSSDGDTSKSTLMSA